MKILGLVLGLVLGLMVVLPGCTTQKVITITNYENYCNKFNYMLETTFNLASNSKIVLENNEENFTSLDHGFVVEQTCADKKFEELTISEHKTFMKDYLIFEKWFDKMIQPVLDKEKTLMYDV